jgi:SH3-like domain-containing protein
VVSRDLNFRVEPRPDAELMAVLTSGQGVTVLAEADGWARIRIDGTRLIGYAPAWALRAGEAELATAAVEVQPAPDRGQARYVTVSGLYLRESPSIESEPVSLLGEDAIVYPLEVAGEWVHVRVHEGPTGWVSRLYLSATPDTAPSGGPTTFTPAPNLARGGMNQRVEALGDNQGMVYQDRVNVRAGPSDQFQVIATMPAGVVFQILGQSSGWYKARFVDGTEGWVASWLCVANSMPGPGGGPVTIVQPEPQPQAQPTGGQPTAIGNEIARLAMTQRGKPYIWGAEDPGVGFDCSGLVLWAHNQVGVSVPRVTFDQFKTGLYVEPSQLIPGDSVFFANTYTGGASHVGIYVGSGYFVHAPGTGQKVRVQPLSDRFDDFCGARRLYVR